LPCLSGQLAKRNSFKYRHPARDSYTQNQPQVQLRINGEIKKMGYIQTLSGKKFDYVNATVDDIEIEDIATALSHICRFAGHLPEFYSVAEHSVLCSQLVPPEFAFEALMHDGSEAYCQDIPAPLKALLPDYRRIEAFVDGLIRFKFDLPLTQSAVVKYADLTMLATERRDLEIDDGTVWPILEGIPTSDIIQIVPLRPGQAYGLFMARFNELMEQRTCTSI
jgi:5'-deoxynucleotidase YfbR-like HD superfamily hydrolase